MIVKTKDSLALLRECANTGAPAPRPVVEVRGVVLVRDGKTGRPKFDLPMHEYPDWAQVEFWNVLTPAEREEFF